MTTSKTFNANNINSSPTLPGIYQFRDKNDHILYVGKAKNLRNRLRNYLAPKDTKTANMTALATSFSIITVDNEIDALVLEANLIKKYLPKFNVNFKDGKNYPFIKITKEEFPKIYIARQIKKDKNKYFGPYPNGMDLKFILKYLRRVFPFCTHARPYKSCLYFHLGLCPGPEFTVDKLTYQKNIRKIILFLDGKKELLLKSLENEIKQCVKLEEFEKAAILQKQIEKIISFRSYRMEPEDYLLDNQTLNNLRSKELQELTNLLNKENINIKSLHTIEGYDIANISGKEATASLVRFKDGNPDKSGYRHFKIKVRGPNDVAMLQETLTRRLSHTEWPMPDLFLIDGGFAQLNAVLTIFTKYSLNIPVISLAKRLEHVCLQNGNEIKPSENSLHLLQRVRDESHRFARRYHHYLRSKLLTNS